MAISISTKADLLSQKPNIGMNVVCEIDGFSDVYGAVHVGKTLCFGDGATFGDGSIFGGNIKHPNSRDYISLKNTTKSISSQVSIESGVEGVRSFKVELIDKNGSLTSSFSPGNTVDDMLGRSATVSILLDGGAHPTDSAKIMEGII